MLLAPAGGPAAFGGFGLPQRFEVEREPLTGITGREALTNPEALGRRIADHDIEMHPGDGLGHQPREAERDHALRDAAATPIGVDGDALDEAAAPVMPRHRDADD